MISFLCTFCNKLLLFLFFLQKHLPFFVYGAQSHVCAFISDIFGGRASFLAVSAVETTYKAPLFPGIHPKSQDLLPRGVPVRRTEDAPVPSGRRGPPPRCRLKFHKSLPFSITQDGQQGRRGEMRRERAPALREHFTRPHRGVGAPPPTHSGGWGPRRRSGTKGKRPFRRKGRFRLSKNPFGLFRQRDAVCRAHVVEVSGTMLRFL